MKLPRKWRILLMTVVSLLVLWFIYYASISVIYGIKLRNLRAQAIATNHYTSLDLEELAKKYNPRPPIAQNAAPLYEAATLLMDKAMGDLPSPESNAYEVLFTTNAAERAKVVSEKHTELASLLKKCGAAIQLLHEAAPYEQAWFDLDYSKGYRMELPHLGRLRALTYPVRIEAWMSATGGDSRKALQAIWTGLRLRRAVEREPFVMSFLVGCMMDASSLQTLQEILPFIQPTDDDLQAILHEVQSRDPKSFSLAMEGRRAWIAMVFESARRDGLAEALRFTINPFPDPGTHDYQHPVRLHAAFVRTANALPVDESYALAFMASLVDDASELRSLRLSAKMRNATRLDLSADAQSRWWRLYHPFSFRLLNRPTNDFTEAKRDIARHDVAACGIAAELYRLDHETYPTSLNVLAPKYLETVPKDTFTGEPLRFKPLPNGVLIYSVGLNGDDDVALSDRDQGTDDIAWRVERPAAGTANP